MERVKRWATSRQGVCSIVLTAFGVAGGVGGGSVRLVDVPVAVAVGLLVVAAVVWVLAAVWEDKTRPATPRFAKGQQSSASKQFREDGNARVWTDHGAFLFEPRCFFVGTGCPPVRLPVAFWGEARVRQQHTPVLVATTPARRFWWYRDGFLWENQQLQDRDVMAMVHARDRRHQREMETAHVLLDVEQGRRTPAARKRQPIPSEVQREVFTRDGGRCVQCESAFQIQYDHVIPHSLGGADTVENLQLLCATCNQRKGASF